MAIVGRETGFGFMAKLGRDVVFRSVQKGYNRTDANAKVDNDRLSSGEAAHTVRLPFNLLYPPRPPLVKSLHQV
jgi:hypothetical protein